MHLNSNVCLKVKPHLAGDQTLNFWDPSIHKVCKCKTLLSFHCMDLLSAVTQRCILSPWHSHLLLRAPLKTFQICVLKNEVKYVTLIPAASSVPPRELTHKCVCVSQCPQGILLPGDGARPLVALSHSPTFPQGHGAGAEPWSLSLPYWIFISDFIKGTTVICHNRTS